MKLADVVQQLDLAVKAGADQLDRDVRKGYASDMLSDVLANSEEGDLWVTLQTHPNVAAVAATKGLAGIVIVNSREPDEETVQKANTENIPVMVSEMGTFGLVGKLHDLGIT